MAAAGSEELGVMHRIIATLGEALAELKCSASENELEDIACLGWGSIRR